MQRSLLASIDQHRLLACRDLDSPPLTGSLFRPKWEERSQKGNPCAAGQRSIGSWCCSLPADECAAMQGLWVSPSRTRASLMLKAVACGSQPPHFLSITCVTICLVPYIGRRHRPCKEGSLVVHAQLGRGHVLIMTPELFDGPRGTRAAHDAGP